MLAGTQGRNCNKITGAARTVREAAQALVAASPCSEHVRERLPGC